MKSSWKVMYASAKRLGLLACTFVAVACAPQEQGGEAVEGPRGPAQVYSVNYPLAYFAERIAGDTVNVVFPAPADVDPASWSPTNETVASFQSADLMLLNGAGYADWIQRVSLSQSRLVNTSAALADRLIPVDDDTTHSHGPGGDHSHKDMAFTTWLDVELAIGQARAVFDALVHLRPEDEPVFRERFTELERELNDLDRRLREVAGRIGNRPLVFSHPVYQYLVRRYELNGRSVHWEPQQVPDDKQWRELTGLLARHPAAWMIWEDQPHADTVNRLAQFGIESIVFRPCANRPAGGDFLSVMQDNLQALEQAFPDSSVRHLVVE